MSISDQISLREGLKEFHKLHETRLSHLQQDMPSEAISFFESHDIAHVVFGSDISLFGEGAVKFWTLFGTTLGFKNHISGYKSANAYQLSQEFNIRTSIFNFGKLIINMPLILYRKHQMSKPWPWSNYEHYLDQKIIDIRQEFNIKIVK